MKRILITVAAVTAAALAVSCQKEEPKVGSESKADFYASLEGPETRLQVSGQGYVYWDGDESISVNGGTYVIEDLSSPTSASFVYEKGPVPEEGRPFCAFYPSFLQSTDSLGILPSEWEYVPGSVTTLPMYAYSENRNLKFRNVCAALKISVDPEITVARLEVTADKAITGAFVVRGDDSLALTGVGSGCTVAFDCGEEGVPGTDFYVPIPAGYYGDIDITIYDHYRYPEEISRVGSMKSVFQHIHVYNNTIYPVEFSTWGQRDLLTDADCEEQCQAVYDAFARNLAAPSATLGCSPLFAAFNLCGDDVMAAEYDGRTDFYAFNTLTYDKDNPVVGEAFYGIVKTICEASSFLKLWSKKDDLTPEMNRCFAEVRVIRAYLQILLSMGWENAPIIDYDIFHTSGEAIDLVNVDKQSDALEWCAYECGEAAKVLEERSSSADKEGVWRVTKGFARAVQGKAFLYVKKYSEAASSLQEVITSGKYELVPTGSYNTLFHSDGNGDKEKVFELKSTPSYGELALFDWRFDSFQADPAALYTGNVKGQGFVGVRQEIAQAAFDTYGNSDRFDATFKHIKDAVCGKYYIDPTINEKDNDQKYASKLVGIKDSINCQSFWLPYKQVNNTSDMGARYFTVMRYADVLLMCAEACLQSGDVSKAMEYLNLILARAGAQPIAQVTMDEVKAERQQELFLEGSRWIDEVRWGDFPKTGVSVTVLYDKLHVEPVGEVVWENETEAESRFYYKTQTVSKQAPDEKYLHFPYPEWFLEMCPNVKQSKGW